MWRNMDEAISQGFADYKDCPAAYYSLEAAIKYRVAQFIWNEMSSKDVTMPGEILEAIAKITK